MQRKASLDKSRNSRGSIQVSDIALDGSDSAELPRIGMLPKYAGKCRDFYRIAQRGSRPVRFDIRNGVRPDPTIRKCAEDHVGLTVTLRPGK